MARARATAQVIDNETPSGASAALGPVARNVRRWRQERELSLSALARNAKLAKSTLSELERGNGNPSIETIWALAQALRIPFSFLLQDGDEADAVRVLRFEEAPIMSSKISGFVTRHLFSRASPGELELYLIELQAGTHRRAKPHSVGVIEHAIPLSGAIEIGPVGKTVTIEPGACVTFRADRPHEYRAVKGSALVLSLHEYPASGGAA